MNTSALVTSRMCIVAAVFFLFVMIITKVSFYFGPVLLFSLFGAYFNYAYDKFRSDLREMPKGECDAECDHEELADVLEPEE